MDMMMKKNKQHDWTDVLRDRLQDARLPLEDGWAAGVDPEIPGNPVRHAPETGGRTGKGGISWPTAALWPWALAGVAAVLAAVLLLRPAKTPAPGLLVQEVPATTVPASDPAPAATPASAAAANTASAATTVTPADASAASSPAPSSKTPVFNNGTGKTATPSSKTPISDNENGNPATPSSKQAVSDNGEEGTANPSPDQAVVSAAQNLPATATAQASTDLSAGGPGTLAEAALQDLPDEPDRQKKARRGPVSLRLQVGSSGGAGALTPSFTNGGIMYASDASLSGDGVIIYPDYDGAIVSWDSNDPNTQFQYNSVTQTLGHPVQSSANTRYSGTDTPVLPVSFGVSAALPMTRRLTLSAGLAYTQRSGARVSTNAEPGQQPAEVAWQGAALHYLGIPVELHGYINPDNRLRFYVGGGLLAEKCIHVTGTEMLPEPVLFSANLQAGVDFRLLRGVRIYLSPSLGYYLNRSSYITNWDDRPLFSLSAGLSFDLKSSAR